MAFSSNSSSMQRFFNILVWKCALFQFAVCWYKFPFFFCFYLAVTRERFAKKLLESSHGDPSSDWVVFKESIRKHCVTFFKILYCWQLYLCVWQLFCRRKSDFRLWTTLSSITFSILSGLGLLCHVFEEGCFMFSRLKRTIILDII